MIFKMRRKHLSDPELLMQEAAEGSAVGRRRKQQHLDACEICQTRASELTAAFTQVQSLYRQPDDPALEAARTRLASALQQTRVVRLSSARAINCASVAKRVVFPGVAAVLLVLGSQFLPGLRHFSGQFLRPWKAASLPSRTLTPGATQAIALPALCSARGSTARMPIDDAVARKVFEEYGLSYASRSSYEVDYLITPGLGGSSDVRNLWPEPEASTGWNARVKDALEDHLHDLVCEGKLPLAAAQSEIAGDWIAAYKKHFHTDRPLRS